MAPHILSKEDGIFRLFILFILQFNVFSKFAKYVRFFSPISIRRECTKLKLNKLTSVVLFTLK
jgi:hypothetical protein